MDQQLAELEAPCSSSTCVSNGNGVSRPVGMTADMGMEEAAEGEGLPPVASQRLQQQAGAQGARRQQQQQQAGAAQQQQRQQQRKAAATQGARSARRAGGGQQQQQDQRGGNAGGGCRTGAAADGASSREHAAVAGGGAGGSAGGLGGGQAVMGGCGLSANTSVLACRAEWLQHQGRHEECYALTERVLERDPYATECLAPHLASALQLGRKNELFLRCVRWGGGAGALGGRGIAPVAMRRWMGG